MTCQEEESYIFSMSKIEHYVLALFGASCLCYDDRKVASCKPVRMVSCFLEGNTEEKLKCQHGLSLGNGV